MMTSILLAQAAAATARRCAEAAALLEGFGHLGKEVLLSLSGFVCRGGHVA